MNIENQEPTSQGWKLETEVHEEELPRFLSEYLSRGKDDRKVAQENSLDLQFSGSNPTLFEGIVAGTAEVSEIQTLYGTDGRPQQIHIVFSPEGKGSNIDVYIQGQVLEDYLRQESL
jgi:hypothetical protein